MDFPPALDEVFGVSNNKQSARNFYKLDVDSLLQEGETVEALKERLLEEEDPAGPLLEISHLIDKNLRVLRDLIQAQRKGERRSRQRHDQDNTAEERATSVTRDRQHEGYKGRSDDEESRPSAERQEDLKSAFLDAGLSAAVADDLADDIVKRGLKYQFVEAALESPAFFTVEPRSGTVLVKLNTNHPAYDNLVEVLEAETEEADVDELRERLQNAREGLRLLLLAWARYEDELPDVRRDTAQEARYDWGRVAKQFLKRTTKTLEKYGREDMGTQFDKVERILVEVLTEAPRPLSTLEIASRVAAHPQWEMRHWEVPLSVVERILQSELQGRVSRVEGRWSLENGDRAPASPRPSTGEQGAPHREAAGSQPAQGDAVARHALASLAIRALRSAFEPLSVSEIALYVGDHHSPRLDGRSAVVIHAVSETMRGPLRERVVEVPAGRWRLRVDRTGDDVMNSNMAGSHASPEESIDELVRRELGSAKKPFTDLEITAKLAESRPSGSSIDDLALLLDRVRRALSGPLASEVVGERAGRWRLRRRAGSGPVALDALSEPVHCYTPNQRASLHARNAGVDTVGDGTGTRATDEAPAEVWASEDEGLGSEDPGPHDAAFPGDIVGAVLAVLSDSNEPISTSEIAWAVARRGGTADIDQIKRVLRGGLGGQIERATGGLWLLSSDYGGRLPEPNDAAESSAPSEDPAQTPPVVADEDVVGEDVVDEEVAEHVIEVLLDASEPLSTSDIVWSVIKRRGYADAGEVRQTLQSGLDGRAERVEGNLWQWSSELPRPVSATTGNGRRA